jgi:F-type H+-transporting ATPase subunit gamma
MQQAELAQQIRTVTQLGDIVHALRALAGARRRQAQERFAGLERYADATRATLTQSLALLDRSDALSTPRTRWIVVLFSEHGFVGALNERLLDFARATTHVSDTELVVVGARGRRLCEERGIGAIDGGAMPTTVVGAQDTAQRLAENWFPAIAERRVDEIRIVFAEHVPPMGWTPRELRLFPPDIASVETPPDARPLHTLDARDLVARAVEEFVFAQVSWAVGEAFASEQAARFAAMDASHKHIDDKLDELCALERALRQETTTNEILEIVSGAGAST